MQFAVASDSGAPALARQAARRTLSQWRLPSLVDDVVLTVSELITNAVRYGRSPVWLTMRLRTRTLHVEVHDGEPRMGASSEAALGEGGRGLDIVRNVATTSGINEIPNDGKDVFATFELPDES